MSIKHYVPIMLIVLIVISIINLTLIKFNQANALPWKAIVTGVTQVFGLLGSLATATDDVKAIAQNVGVMPEESKQETTTSSSPTKDLETTTSPSSPTPDPEMASQIKELTHRLKILESQLETLDYNEKEMALNEIGQTYVQELENYSPQEQELINQNFQYVAPEKISEKADKALTALRMSYEAECSLGMTSQTIPGLCTLFR